jgi:FtsP/CotA-like multicopper oxidase with cupredoxin domain
MFPPPIAWSSEKPPFTAGGSSLYNYNPFTTAPSESPAGSYNLVNPLMRDTVFIPQRGYAVIRFRADNKGIWMLHCHVGWHLGSGMAMSWDVS